MVNSKVAGVTKITGWKARRLATVTLYRCRNCGQCRDILYWGSDGLAECFRCHKTFPYQEFEPVKRKRTIVECVDCGRDVRLVPSTFGITGLGFICSDCSNYVAVLYGNRFTNPSVVLEVSWNPTAYDRSESVSSKRLRFLRCMTVKDFLVVQVLQAIAKGEDSRFMFARAKEHCAGLLLDSNKQKYLGFLVWTEERYAVLRQIFILEDERRKGHAEKLIKFWVERYADRLHEKFGIEAPNEKAMNLHLKLGHVKLKGDSYVGVKCFRVASF